MQELDYIGSVTGYYGTETIDAVKAFQTRNDLGVDGKTGEMTLDCIYSSDVKPTAEMEVAGTAQRSIDSFISVAEEQLGKPYVWGRPVQIPLDCSGLVTYCLRQAGSSTGGSMPQGFHKIHPGKDIF